MSQTVDHPEAIEVEAAPAPEAAVPVIIELRPVELSPVGKLFDQFPMDRHVLARESFFRRNMLFLLLFVLPVAIAGTYFGLIASDVYVTEVKYIVRMAAGGEAGGLSSLVQSQGFSRAVDESYAINEYLTSRQIIPLLTRDHDLLNILGRPEADFIARFPNIYARNNQEALYQHLKNVISIEPDPSTGINTLEVRTFRPEDSYKLARALLHQGEEFINQMNNRANDDALEFAETIRKEAIDRIKDVETRLTEYRNKEMILDPAREAAATVQALGAMAADITVLEAQASEQRALTPNSPGAAALREKLKARRAEYDKLRGTLVGSESSLASKISGYEALMLEKELSARALTSAILGLEKARQDAKSRRIYLQEVVSPGISDYATRPYRLLWTLASAGLAFCVYWIARTFRDTVLEHQA